MRWQWTPCCPSTPHPAQLEVWIPGYGFWSWLTFPICPGSSHLLDAPIELKLCWGATGTGQRLQHHVLEIWGAG